MKFGHEKLDVYQVAPEYAAWAYGLAKGLRGADRHARDQLLRASQSIPQNIAEGNGRGSALECAAIQDTLVACDVLKAFEISQGKAMLIRIVAMLTKMGRRDYRVWEGLMVYRGFDYENDHDHDHDDDQEDHYEERP